MLIKKEIKLPNQDISFQVFLGKDFLSSLERLIDSQKYSACLLVADEKLKEFSGPLKNFLRQNFPKQDCLFLPGGEKSKSLKVANKLYQKLIRLNFDRQSLLLAFGGGTIGDLTGFVAATYLRGIKFIQLPTTLLAQVDAAVGGKTALNFAGLKNIIGAFYQPKAIIIDIQTLQTLPEKEWRAGLAEVIKYALIADPSLLTLLNQYNSTKNHSLLLTIINRCLDLKINFVKTDEKYKSQRIFLNFGHTIGHAIEASANFYNHGEAVAIGIMGACLISQLTKLSNY